MILNEKMGEERIAQLIGGTFDKLFLRSRRTKEIQLGEILVYENQNKKYFIQVTDLTYGSQISQENLEMISGLNLEQNHEITLFDDDLQVYTLCVCKNLIIYDKQKKQKEITKSLPPLLSEFRRITEQDLEIFSFDENPLFLGLLRSGSNDLNVNVSIDIRKVFQHHVLVAATTGRGKSNLTSVMLWQMLDNDGFGFLVLDPHDEYYGRANFGLKDNLNSREKLVYYTNSNPPANAYSLIINVKNLFPSHFNGVAKWSDAQREALYSYNLKYKEKWIEKILTDENSLDYVQSATLSAIKRRLINLLDANVENNKIMYNGIFTDNGGESTIKDICDFIEEGKTVIIDSSNISSQQEILIGSIVTSLLFSRYKNYKREGKLRDKAQVVVVLEEAPRVLGRDVLKSGNNIFSTIAREGRKFKIGLFAITQLPSLIPREILANMNTKIIMGIEMKPERLTIIESSPNDLSSDEHTIASLGVGEAIITSTFLGFPLPVKIFSFLEFKKTIKKEIEENKKRFTRQDLELF